MRNCVNSAVGGKKGGEETFERVKGRRVPIPHGLFSKGGVVELIFGGGPFLEVKRRDGGENGEEGGKGRNRKDLWGFGGEGGNENGKAGNGAFIKDLRKLRELRELALAGAGEGGILASFRKGVSDDAERDHNCEGCFAGACWRRRGGFVGGCLVRAGGDVFGDAFVDA